MNHTQTTGTPGEQPADAQVIAAAEESAQPFSGDVATLIDSMDQESLMAMLDGNPLPDQPAPPVEPTPPEPPPQDDGELQPGEQPVEERPPQHSDDGAATTLKRMSLRGLPEDQAAQMVAAKNAVKDGLVPDLATYFRQISGETPAAATEQPAAQPPESQPEPPSAVADLQAQLATLREQRKQAKLDYDTESESALTDRIEDTLLEIQTARIAEANQAAQASAYQQAHERAVDMVEAKYGDLLDNEASPFGRFLSQAVLAAKATNDPALQDPKFIMSFADQIARDLGIIGTTKAAPKAAATQPQGPPARASRPVGSTMAPGHSQAPRFTPDQLKQVMAAATAEDILAVL